MRRLGISLGLVVTSAVFFRASAQEAKPSAGVADDFVSAGSAPPLPEPLAAALAGIRAESLAAHIAFLASPALEGRGLGSRGLDAAAEYAAASMALAGVPPLAAGYFQAVPLREVSGLAGEVTVETRQGGSVQTLTFASGEDCLLPEIPPQTLTAPVVFAGHGIREEKRGHDDYAGLDVRGKIVLVLRGVPGGEAWRDPEVASRYDARKPGERWEAKQETAGAAGAVAVLAAEGDDFANDVATRPRPTSFFLPLDAANDAPPVVRVSPAVARALLATVGLDTASTGTAKPRELPGVTATLRAAGTVRLTSSRNVFGLLAGSDPELRDEVVILGAHLDHLGRSGDLVHPGADDNASGVSAALEIARAFAWRPTRPRRTVAFAFWTGEEDGKLGSGYYVRHPLRPLARTRAYVNLDMIGHPWRPEELRKLVTEKGLPGADEFLAKVDPRAFTDPGLPLDAAHVEEALRWAGPAAGMTLYLDRTDGTHGGSDYRDFARARVPWVRFFGNFFPGYHEPGDTPANLDPAQVQRMARLAFATAWHLAER